MSDTPGQRTRQVGPPGRTQHAQRPPTTPNSQRAAPLPETAESSTALPGMGRTPEQDARPEGALGVRRSTRASNRPVRFVAGPATYAEATARTTPGTEQATKERQRVAGTMATEQGGPPIWPAHLVAQSQQGGSSHAPMAPAAERVVELTTYQTNMTERGSRRTSLPSETSSDDRSLPGSQTELRRLEVQGGQLQERLSRFKEVINGGGGSRSCWAIATWGQLNKETKQRLDWQSVADVRAAVAAYIEGGTAREKRSRLVRLRESLGAGADPDPGNEILEQRAARPPEGKSRATSLEQSVTLEEYARYVRENRGNGFSGGLRVRVLARARRRCQYSHTQRC
jgi:hypothetical protein